MSIESLIEERLLRELDPKVKLVLEVGRYIIGGGGKRLRPTLTLLVCKMCGGEVEEALPLAVGLEYIHVASLLHDDVVDNATKRRGKTSPNLVFGNGVSVLTGDYLYAKALNLFSKYGSLEMIRLVSGVVMEMAQAQVLEISRVGNIISEGEYFKIIDGKTASLFGASFGVGAMVGGCRDYRRLYRVGLHLGRAFQLIDDLLDYLGVEERLGKPVASDLKEGKCTYPLISVLEKISKEWVEEVLRKGQGVRELVEEVIRLGGGVRTKERAKEEVQRALEILKEFPKNPYRERIEELAKQIIDRDF